MSRNKHRVPFQASCLIILLILLCLSFPLQVAADSAGCETEVLITGLLLDEEAKPICHETLYFQFYTGSSFREIERTTETDAQGMFQLETTIRHDSYREQGSHMLELQGWLQLPDTAIKAYYEPGRPRQIEEQPTYRGWAGAGTYTDEIELFYYIMIGTDEDEEPDFTGWAQVILGSEADPCILQLERELPPPDEEEVELFVRHLDAITLTEVAPVETYTLTPENNPQQLTIPREITGMAPIRVELSGELRQEAVAEQPIIEHLVEHPRVGQADLLDIPPPETMELIYYYHLDRDGDGIPDFLVTEQYADEGGEALPGPPEPQTFILANQTLYEGSPPDILGYQYLGYEKDGEEQSLHLPRETIAADVSYCYLYQQDVSESNPGSGGNKGKGDDKTEEPTEEPNPEPPDPEKPDPIPPPDEGETGTELPPEESLEPEPAAPPPPGEGEPETESEPPPEQPASALTVSAQAPEPPPSLTEAERAEKRNITFTKRSLTKEVQPGEEVSYSFSGFENGFPYPLTGFTIIDRPDPGLDFVRLELPAFRQGEQVRYDVVYATNVQGEQVLIQNYPADQSLSINEPRLATGEYITAIYVRMGEVPVGFGQNDKLTTTFRVWEDPPQDQLHNLGVLYYEELEEPVECLTEEAESSILIRLLEPFGVNGGPGGPSANNQLAELAKSPSGHTLWRYLSLLLLLAVIAGAIQYQRCKQTSRGNNRFT